MTGLLREGPWEDVVTESNCHCRQFPPLAKTAPEAEQDLPAQRGVGGAQRRQLPSWRSLAEAELDRLSQVSMRDSGEAANVGARPLRYQRIRVNRLLEQEKGLDERGLA